MPIVTTSDLLEAINLASDAIDDAKEAARKASGDNYPLISALVDAKEAVRRAQQRARRGMS